MNEVIAQLLGSFHAYGWLLTASWTAYIVAMAVWIVLEKREPAATLGWIFGLAALPFIGFVVYSLIGPRRIRRHRQRRLRARAVRDAPLPVDEGEAMHPQLAALAKATTGIGPLHTLAPTLLRDGADTYDAMLEAIAGARDHIHLASYIYDADTTGGVMRDALIAKARAGIKVRLLVDSVGSSRLRHSFFRDLVAAGGELAWFHPVRFRPLRRSTLNLRSHRKILVVDGRTGFTGGVNISDTQDRRQRADAHCDLHLRFSGSAVSALQLCFLEDWSYASGKTGCDGNLWPTPEVGGAPALVLPSGPDSPWEAFHRLSVELIHEASERIWLVTPYFVPSEAARMALTNASLRGVDVRVMLPRHSDSILVSAAARSYYDELLAAGVRIFEYQPRLLHAKATLVDQNHVMIGSGNFDTRSFRLNFELSMLIADADLAADMEVAWHDYVSRAIEVEPGKRGSLLRRLGEAAARPLSPLL